MSGNNVTRMFGRILGEGIECMLRDRPLTQPHRSTKVLRRRHLVPVQHRQRRWCRAERRLDQRSPPLRADARPRLPNRNEITSFVLSGNGPKRTQDAHRPVLWEFRTAHEGEDMFCRYRSHQLWPPFSDAAGWEAMTATFPFASKKMDEGALAARHKMCPAAQSQRLVPCST